MARIIKRYANRKLYDTEASAYVSLADVAALVRRGATVQVVDASSGDDLTAQTLTQIILDEGKRGHDLISPDLLHDVLRRSNRAIDSGLKHLKHSVDDLVQQSLDRFNALRPARQHELQELRQQLNHLEHLLAKVLQPEQEGPPSAPAASPTKTKPS